MKKKMSLVLVLLLSCLLLCGYTKDSKLLDDLYAQPRDESRSTKCSFGDLPYVRPDPDGFEQAVDALERLLEESTKKSPSAHEPEGIF